MKKERYLLQGLLFWLLLCLAAWAYWPGIFGPSLLDDSVNLREISKLDSNDAFLYQSIFENRSGPLGRPVAMASFVLEKVYIDRGVWGSKALNLSIHLLTGCIVFWLAFRLFLYCGYRTAAKGALWVTAMWLLSPLLISTVLYPVQRMAQLSTLFSLLALLIYCSWRENPLGKVRGLAQLPLVLICVALATLSKENGLLSIPLIVLLELFVFRFSLIPGQTSPKYRKYLYFTVIAACISASVFLIALLMEGYLSAAYLSRDFTLLERLMTEARILWHYCYQLLLPNVLEMGVYQDDYPISSGLFSPLTTLWALLGWLAAFIAIGISPKTRLGRLLAFSLVFFLIAHAMESTILPLELYFEHRNYLPAFGIYFGIAALGLALSEKYPTLKNTVISIYLIWIMFFVYATSSQAYVWSNKFLLHFNALKHHPQSPRANIEASRLLAEQGVIEPALELSNKVTQIQGGPAMRHHSRNLLLYCLSGNDISVKQIQELKSAPKYFDDGRLNENIQLLVELLIEGRCSGFDAVSVADLFAEVFYDQSAMKATGKILIMMAILENHNGRYERADIYAKEFLKKYPGDVKALLMRLYFTSLLEKPEDKTAIVEQLIEYRQSGQLNQQQQYTLELFL
jgi:protein O-mannosyl-transferase